MATEVRAFPNTVLGAQRAHQLAADDSATGVPSRVRADEQARNVAIKSLSDMAGVPGERPARQVLWIVRNVAHRSSTGAGHDPHDDALVD